MNSEQILLMVAALGVATISVVTSLGAKKKPQTLARASTGARDAKATARANRAERRKKR